MKKIINPIRIHEILIPVCATTALSVFLFVVRWISGDTPRYWFMNWNLFLAWMPLIFACLLYRWLQNNRWLTVKGILMSFLWLGFLPNAFYLVTDFIHLKPTGEASLLYDGVMFMTYAWNGLVLGFISVYIVHKELLKRLSVNKTILVIITIFVLCSFAIYLGRHLTWNTWDIVVNPAGILVDLSDRIIRPKLYPNTFTTTAIFSIVLPVMYYSVYKIAGVMQRARV